MTGEVVLETLWPTRCAVCDLPGFSVLCDDCERSLPVVDACKACPRCGAPHGMIQCTECNDVTLRSLKLEALPMDSMAHALIASEDVKAIIKLYKDADERRLLDFISSRIADVISPDLKKRNYVITFIPDTAKAKRRRGFDHAEEIAEAVGMRSGLECRSLFKIPTSIDQRALDKQDRLANMRNALSIREDASIPESALIIDDVCTTGATIYSAALALKAAGVRQVSAATFAKV